MIKSGRLFWGLCFVTLAVFMILSQFGVITAHIGVGSIILGILYLSILVGSITSRSFGGVFLALGLSWVTFGDALGLPSISIWTALLIVILLTIGCGILFPHRRRKRFKKKMEKKWAEYESEDLVGEHQQVVDRDKNGFVVCENKFGALAKYINTRDFKGAYLKNSFGELKIYLDQATIITSPVELNINSSFGSMQLFIPKEWNVQTNVFEFAGQCVENNSCSNVTEPLVTINGNVYFGEIVITYV